MPWRFKGLSFGVVADSAIFEEWFATKTILTVDPVLGGGPLRYTDIGATDIPPMPLTAQWSGASAVADRATLKSYYQMVGLLEDDNGRSCQALLSECVEIRVRSTTSGYTRLGVAFVYVSA